MMDKELKIVIDGKYPSLNDFISALRKNRFIGNALKTSTSDAIGWETKKQIPHGWKTIYEPCFIEFHFFEENRKRDKDNVASFFIKCGLDAFQKIGLIGQDNWSVIEGYTNKFYISKEHPRIEITIKY